MRPRALGGIGALVLALASSSIAAQAPTPTPAPSLELPDCVSCHEDQGKKAPGSPHARIPGAEYGKAGVGNAPCSSCHGPGTKHMESSG
ncbi:MAG TPA: hypothetical protein VKG01_03115, partial [Thermoanaerobaculia bacterium]|nr:hypothetical protein [Thermoanaerobaculia bacterium]